MNSSQTLIDPAASSASQEAPLPALEGYWQKNLTDCKVWNLGVRAAAHWQHIAMDSQAFDRTTISTISDTYSLGGTTPPGAPFNGSFGGPNDLLGDTPTRTETSVAGPMIAASRDIDADLFGLGLGPTLSANITDNLCVMLSAGATVAWIKSDFSYRDGTLGSGSVTNDKWLLGPYAGADLKYRLSEHWGIFVGATYTHLDDFTQQAQGHSASLQFDHNYSLHTGVYFN